MDSILDRSLGPGFDALERLLDVPEEREQYERDVRVMMMTRQLLMAIDAERQRRGMTKNELAELVGANPQVIRRLFTSERANPTLKTVLGILAALRIEWVFNLPEAVSEAVTTVGESNQISGEAAVAPEEKRAQTPTKSRRSEAA